MILGLAVRAGAPSLGDARLTRGRKPVPRTTAWRIVNRKGLPASTEQLVMFLTVCGIHSAAAQRRYVDAYQHVIAQRGTRPVPWHAPCTQLAPRTTSRVRPGPLARGKADTDARFELPALVAGVEVLAAAVEQIDMRSKMVAALEVFVIVVVVAAVTSVAITPGSHTPGLGFSPIRRG
ncbi:XRE family transcriptional regulator, partial [Streptomyces sp. NPDC087437]